MNKANRKALWIVGIALASVVGRVWQVGDRRLGLLLLGMVFVGLLFALAAGGIAWLRTPKRHREILGQLTADERGALGQLAWGESTSSDAATQGRKLGILLLPIALVCGFLCSYLHVQFGNPLLTTSVLVVVVALAVSIAMLRTMHHGLRVRQTLDEVLRELDATNEPVRSQPGNAAATSPSHDERAHR